MALPTLPTKSLFDLYKKEKEYMDDPIQPFPPFSVWKRLYLKERQIEMNNTDISDIPTVDLSSVIPLETDEDGEIVNPPKATTKVKPAPIKKKKLLTNMDRARIIFKELVESSDEMPTRKEVMGAFVAQLKVSTACASTYHYNIKQKYEVNNGNV